MNQPETTRKKARNQARLLGHKLTKFRRKEDRESAYCKSCFKYAFIDEGEVRGGAVSEVCHFSNKGLNYERV